MKCVRAGRGHEVPCRSKQRGVQEEKGVDNERDGGINGAPRKKVGGSHLPR